MIEITSKKENTVNCNMCRASLS